MNEAEQLPIFIEPDEPETFPKILLIAGGAIGLVIIICVILTSMLKTPSISKIDMPEKSALEKKAGEVAGANTAEVLGPQRGTKTSPTEKPSPTADPTSSPTNTPTPTPSTNSGSTTADPTNTPTPTPTETPTPTPTETPTPTAAP